MELQILSTVAVFPYQLRSKKGAQIVVTGIYAVVVNNKLIIDYGDDKYDEVH